MYSSSEIVNVQLWYAKFEQPLNCSFVFLFILFFKYQPQTGHILLDIFNYKDNQQGTEDEEELI